MRAIFYCLLIFISIPAFSQRPSAIYNVDDRREVFEIEDREIRTLADSSVAFFTQEKLKKDKSGYVLSDLTLGQDLNLCPEERFRDQPSSAFCSGTLIGPDLILTAGHCLKKSECPKTLFAFGYRMRRSAAAPHHFSESEVYSCKEILARKNTDKLDYAIVRLDREVLNHAPVVLAEENIAKFENVYMLGFSSGLPLKFSGFAQVVKQFKNHSLATLDSFAGNSGSGVYSAVTHKLIGVLVQGNEDYYLDKSRNCQKAFICSKKSCDGEQLTNIEPILKVLDQVL